MTACLSRTNIWFPVSVSTIIHSRQLNSPVAFPLISLILFLLSTTLFQFYTVDEKLTVNRIEKIKRILFKPT